MVVTDRDWMPMESWSSCNGKKGKFLLDIERKHMVDISLMHGGYRMKVG